MYGGEIHLCACYETLSLSTFRSWEFEVTKKLEKGSSRYYKDWRVRKVNSDKVQQWYTKTRVLHAGKVNYNVSQSVLFSLFKTQFHAHRPSFHWTTLPFPSVSILLLLAQVSGFRSMEIPSPSSMIWLPVRCPTILLGSFRSDWCLPQLLEHPCLLRCHLDFLRCYHAASAPTPTWLSSFVPSLVPSSRLIFDFVL